MNIKDKIKKLLALGKSPNEHEAKLALLKAKKLMMEHKLTEADISEKNTKLIHKDMPSIRWTTDSGDIWMNELCELIAENNLCTIAWCTPVGSRTHSLVLTGLEEDAEVCSKVIEFIVGFVKQKIKEITIFQNNAFDKKVIKQSYAIGFVNGLRSAYEEQREEHVEWGLVEVKPKEVNEYEKSLSKKNVKTRQTQKMDMGAYLDGVTDGAKVNQRRVIE